MTSWSDTPVLSGVTYRWITGRDSVTSFFSGRIHIPAGREVPCASCLVPHENNSGVFCYDPWAVSKESRTPRYPVICADCHTDMR